MSIPKRVAERIQQNLKQFQQILEAQRARDVSEADTVTVVKDVLEAVFGYDKYADLTSEHSIRGTYCDLAVKLDTKLAFLIEVKAIGLDLKDSHIKQAVDYASNQGCEWVVLTNGVEWRLYHILFKKPIEKQEIAHFDLLQCNPRNAEDLDRLYLLTREGFTKSAMADYRDRKDATSRFLLAAIVTGSTDVLTVIRREVRRVSEIIVSTEDIEKILKDEVIKRETLEGDQADVAARRFARVAAARQTDERPPTPESSATTAPQPTPLPAPTT